MELQHFLQFHDRTLLSLGVIFPELPVVCTVTYYTIIKIRTGM